jgi:6-pyruvoyltetrahydropterin/6-carboxytetrahydropterin synthase
MGESSIFVDHNAEVAHRLTSLPGKCEQIHGHSLQVRLTVTGQVSHSGVLGDLDFGQVKAVFREYMDHNYDHHLVLNEKDPWAQNLTGALPDGVYTQTLPGLVTVPGDPTIENIARWVCQDMKQQFMSPTVYGFEVNVRETNTNGATFKCRVTGGFAG